jgi:hypothetical protein
VKLLDFDRELSIKILEAMLLRMLELAMGTRANFLLLSALLLRRT